MAAILQAITHNIGSILTFAGLTPHRVVPSSAQYRPSKPIFTLDQLDKTLKNGVEGKVLSSDEAGDLHARAVDVGMPTDSRAFIDRICGMQVSAELGDLSFRLCDRETCTMLPGIRHGRFYYGDDQLDEQVPTVSHALDQLQLFVGGESPICTTEQAILLLRQVVAAGIPIDNDHFDVIMGQIPEETKAAHRRRLEEVERAEGEELGIRVSEVNLGGMRGVLVELDMGRLLAEMEPPSLFERLFGRRG